MYILQCKDETFYTGITTDLERRFTEHMNGKGAKYTKGRGPFKIVYKEKNITKGSALKRELKIKSLSRAAKMILIDKYNS